MRKKRMPLWGIIYFGYIYARILKAIDDITFNRGIISMNNSDLISIMASKIIMFMDDEILMLMVIEYMESYRLYGYLIGTEEPFKQ